MTDRRWIILANDGRHVTTGKCAEPTDKQLDASAAALRKLGLGGWLCVMDGHYYRTGNVSLLMVRPLAECDVTVERAVEWFFTRRGAETGFYNRAHR